MLRNFLRLVDLGCDALTVLALPAVALIWVSGWDDAVRQQWMHAQATGSGEPWRHAAVLFMAAIARSFTRDRAELQAQTLLENWQAAGHERMRRVGSALCVWPWCVYVLWAGAPGRSLSALPGGVVSNESLALMQALVWCIALALTLHALLDIFAPRRAALPSVDTADSR